MAWTVDFIFVINWWDEILPYPCLLNGHHALEGPHVQTMLTQDSNLRKKTTIYRYENQYLSQTLEPQVTIRESSASKHVQVLMQNSMLDHAFEIYVVF